jgi:hypothetical protein
METKLRDRENCEYFRDLFVTAGLIWYRLHPSCLLSDGS